MKRAVVNEKLMQQFISNLKERHYFEDLGLVGGRIKKGMRMRTGFSWSSKGATEGLLCTR